MLFNSWYSYLLVIWVKLYNNDDNIICFKIEFCELYVSVFVSFKIYGALNIVCDVFVGVYVILLVVILKI